MGGISVDSSHYFQRLSLCETIQRTAVVIASDLAVFAQLGFVTIGPFVVVWACLLLVLMPALGLDANQINDPAYLVDHLGPFYGMLFINLLVCVVTTAAGNGAMVRAVAELYLQRRPSAKACIHVGIRHSVAIITASILALTGALVGCLFFVLPGYYVMVNWCLVNPVIIIEGLGAIAAMKRSWNLVSGSWCYVFGTAFVCGAGGIALQLVWQSLFAFNTFTFTGSIVNSIPSFIATPIVAVMKTILYMNLRIEKEGLNAEVLARELGNTGKASYSSVMVEHFEDEPPAENKQVSVSNAV